MAVVNEGRAQAAVEEVLRAVGGFARAVEAAAVELKRLADSLGVNLEVLADVAPVDPEVRSCVECGGEVLRRRGESRSAWLRRRFCCRACSNGHARRAQSELEMSRLPARHCERCGVLLVRRGEAGAWTEALKDFKERRFCGVDCSRAVGHGATSRRRAQSELAMSALEPRQCDGCGEVLVRRGEPGAWAEKLNHFKKRRYCSRDCMRAHRGSSALPASRPKPTPRLSTAAPRRKLDVFSVVTAPSVPWSPPAPSAPPAVMVPDGDVNRCLLHGDVLGVYGCPACNAAERWRARDRVIRPGGEQLW